MVVVVDDDDDVVVVVEDVVVDVVVDVEDGFDWRDRSEASSCAGRGWSWSEPEDGSAVDAGVDCGDSAASGPLDREGAVDREEEALGVDACLPLVERARFSGWSWPRSACWWV